MSAAAAAAAGLTGGTGGSAADGREANSKGSRVLGSNLTGPMRPTMALAFVDDGERLVSAAGQLMYVWDRAQDR